jgi:hypothetical protein
MDRPRLDPPSGDEYAPYFEAYVSRVRDRHVVGLLLRQTSALHSACEGMDDSGAGRRYAPDKWSVKQVLGHLADTERVLAYRLLRVGRGDPTPLSAFDENAYVAAAGFDDRSLPDLLQDFHAVRQSTLRLVDGLPIAALSRWGAASGAPITARALLYVLVGHVEHHFEILRGRYGVGITPADRPGERIDSTA